MRLALTAAVAASLSSCAKGSQHSSHADRAASQAEDRGSVDSPESALDLEPWSGIERGSPERTSSKDSRPPADSKGSKDSSKADLKKVDLKAPADAAPPAQICDPVCQDEDLTYCVKDSGYCVECTTTAHCAANPASLGPKCDASEGWCVCSTSADCATSAWGSYCDTGEEACGCTSTSHCGAGSLGGKCSYGYCGCGSSADCTGKNLGHYCYTSLQACGCQQSSDCPSGRSCTGNLGNGAWKYCQ